MPIAELAPDGARINLDTDYRDREIVKLVPGTKWDETARTWWLPLSWAACVQMRGVFGAELQIGERLNAWAALEQAQRIGPCLALRVADDAPDLAFLTTLYPYQRAGVAFLSTARQALMADEMGTGKTVQTIASLEVIGDSAYPALIVCPNSMKLTWSDEFARWAPGRTVQVIHGTPAKRRGQIQELIDGRAHVGIINYEGLRAHTRLARFGMMTISDEERAPKELNSVLFRSVVADEAHRAKEPKSKQTRALWYVGDQAEYRFALTGTPIANSPDDLWAIMRFVSPTEFPAKTQFVTRYALQDWNAFGFMETKGLKPESKDELFRILDPRFIRRLKKSVLPQLPEKVYSTRYVEMGAPQKKAYTAMKKDMLTQLRGGTLMATDPLQHMLRLTQFASASGELVPDGTIDEQGNPILQLKLTAPSCKADALLDIVEELGDQQAVVFAYSRQVIEICSAALTEKAIRHGLITGTVSTYDRQANVNAFQAGTLPLLLLTMGAGGEGLTLTAASTAIFLQRSFSLPQNLQAEDRIHRIGQDANKVEIIDVITQDTVESRVHAIRATKADRLEEVVRDEATLKLWLSK